jgi:VWFA-related protein
MQCRRMNRLTGTICIGICQLTLLVHLAQSQQTSADTSAGGTVTIHTETRLVLVDTIVTDKSGNYIRDLTAKNFKVLEDNKEQPIKSFSLEDDTASPAKAQTRYVVLFFDNSTMDIQDQMRARHEAAKFIDANTALNRLVAIVDFGGSVRIAQNFTADAARLKQVVVGLKSSSVSPNAAQPVEVASLTPAPMPIGTPSFFGNAEADFGAHTLMIALRNVAKGLGPVPGRKTVVLLTSGFPATPERQSELTSVIAVCNRYNVAVYPLDVRGLVAGVGDITQSSLIPSAPHSVSGQLLSATLSYSGNGTTTYRLKPAYFSPAQRGGGGGHGGGGGTGGGGSGSGGGGRSGGTGGTGGGRTGGTGGGTRGGGTSARNPSQSYAGNPYTQPRQIVPPLPDVSLNQQILYQLAEGTGGFVIANSNDLAGGMEKIAKDQSHYYVLGYAPPESTEGSCHSLRVKVDRSGTLVRARSGYCNVKPLDMLAGNPVEKGLETRVNGEMAGNVTADMQAPFFYTSPNTARVNLAMDIPSSVLKFEKVKGKQHSAINVLGIAYKPDGTIAARFSDTVNFDFDDKKELEEFQKRPVHYENQFSVASGQYVLKVVFSSGNETFGKLQRPLFIDSYDGRQFSMSSLALSNEILPVSTLSTGLDSELLADRTPLVVRDMRITPSASNQFQKTDSAALYAEIYAPLLAGSDPPKVEAEMVIWDRKTGQKRVDFKTSPASQAGSRVVPLGLKVPVDALGPGSYRVELNAADSAGNHTNPRMAYFEVE